MRLSVGLVGLGAIARAQHLPAIAATEGLQLAAIASRNATLPDLPSFPDVAAMLSDGPVIDVVSLCTPPQGRFEQAMTALQAGCHLMLEKPPGMTLGEIEILRRTAAQKGVTLFATWHSREAAAVAAARDWLAGRKIRAVRIDWREDVRKWHPGQDWIWRPGGLGVFDPGINALSILTRILPDPVRLTGAHLSVPRGCQTPIAAELTLRAGDTDIRAGFDWRETGNEVWRIALDTGDGTALLDKGGAELRVGDRVLATGDDREYRALYARLRDLVAAGQSDVDTTPMVLVADAFLNASVESVAPPEALADV